MSSVLTGADTVADTDSGDMPPSGRAMGARPQEPIPLLGGRICIGRVGAPPRQEATSVRFYF